MYDYKNEKHWNKKVITFNFIQDGYSVKMYVLRVNRLAVWSIR